MGNAWVTIHRRVTASENRSLSVEDVDTRAALRRTCRTDALGIVRTRAGRESAIANLHFCFLLLLSAFRIVNISVRVVSEWL